MIKKLGKKILSVGLLSIILFSGNNTDAGMVPTFIIHKELRPSVSVDAYYVTVRENGFYYSGWLTCKKGLCEGALTLDSNPYE